MAIRILHPLFAILASVTRQELARQVAYLKAENELPFRARLPKQIVTTAQERQRLLRAGRKLGVKLRDLISIVTYPTFCRWVREAEGKHLRQNGTEVIDRRDRPPGRPKKAEEIRDLVIRIRKETNYGYTKILQTLRRLGVKVSRQTVKNILDEAGLEPPPNSSDNWDSFLKRHAETLWQIDFCCKPMWTVRGIVDVYLLVCLHLGTRRMWISPCTVSPDAVWVERQSRNFLMHADDLDLSPKLVIHDRDTKFTARFDEILTSADCAVHETAPLSPNLQAHVERAIQTLKHECLNAFVVVSERHLNRITREFQAWYNHERGHTARDHLPPACDQKPEPVTTLRPNDIVCTTRLGGHLKSYARRAA